MGFWDWISGAVNKIKEGLEKVGETISEGAKKVGEAISNAVDKAIDWVEEKTGWDLPEPHEEKGYEPPKTSRSSSISSSNFSKLESQGGTSTSPPSIPTSSISLESGSSGKSGGSSSYSPRSYSSGSSSSPRSSSSGSYHVSSGLGSSYGTYVPQPHEQMGISKEDYEFLQKVELPYAITKYNIQKARGYIKNLPDDAKVIINGKEMSKTEALTYLNNIERQADQEREKLRKEFEESKREYGFRNDLIDYAIACGTGAVGGFIGGGPIGALVGCGVGVAGQYAGEKVTEITGSKELGLLADLGVSVVGGVVAESMLAKVMEPKPIEIDFQRHLIQNPLENKIYYVGTETGEVTFKIPFSGTKKVPYKAILESIEGESTFAQKYLLKVGDEVSEIRQIGKVTKLGENVEDVLSLTKYGNKKSVDYGVFRTIDSEILEGDIEMTTIEGLYEGTKVRGTILTKVPDEFEDLGTNIMKSGTATKTAQQLKSLEETQKQILDKIIEQTQKQVTKTVTGSMGIVSGIGGMIDVTTRQKTEEKELQVTSPEIKVKQQEDSIKKITDITDIIVGPSSTEKTSTETKTKTKQGTEENQETSETTIEDTSTIEVTEVKTILSQDIEEIQEQIEKTIQGLFSGPSVKVKVKIPKGDFDSPAILPEKKPKKDKAIKKKIEPEYSPSLGGLIWDIHGEIEEVTGFEPVRPIPKRKRKKKTIELEDVIL